MAEELYFMEEFGGCCVTNEINEKDDFKFRGKCLLPSHYKQFADKILGATVREDDVWLVSYPRTGELLIIME